MSTSNSSANQASKSIFRGIFHRLVPSLSIGSHKGQAGKLTIIGGSKAYTGAPYFSAMSGMKLGADLSTVLCSVEAAVPIKSYSPELMVRPTLIPKLLINSTGISEHCGPNKPESQIVESVSKEIIDFFEKTSVLIIGPGLGREDSTINKTVIKVMEEAVKRKIPMVIDGDGINILTESPDFIQHNKSFENIIITPNAAEFKRLWKAFLPNEEEPPMALPVDENLVKFMEKEREIEGGLLNLTDRLALHTVKLAAAMNNITVIRKGPIDIISDGRKAIYCARTGAPRRCGGQGDVLAGCAGTTLGWAVQKQSEENKENYKNSNDYNEIDELNLSNIVQAAYCAALITRRAAEIAFSQHGRSMLAHHLVDACEIIMEEWSPVKGRSAANKHHTNRS